MFRIARLAVLAGLLLPSCHGYDGQEGPKQQTSMQQGVLDALYEQLVPEGYRVPYGQLLFEGPPKECQQITYCFYSRDRKLEIRDERPRGAPTEAEVPLEFYPLAIAGQHCKTVYLAGVDAAKARVDRLLVDPATLTVRDSETVFAGSGLGYPTGMDDVTIGDKSYLLVLDAGGAALWLLHPDDKQGRVLARGEVLEGMRSLEAIYDPEQQELSLLLTKHFGRPDFLPDEEEVAVLTDQGADFSFEKAEKCRWGDFIAE